MNIVPEYHRRKRRRLARRLEHKAKEVYHMKLVIHKPIPFNDEPVHKFGDGFDENLAVEAQESARAKARAGITLAMGNADDDQEANLSGSSVVSKFTRNDVLAWQLRNYGDGCDNSDCLLSMSGQMAKIRLDSLLKTHGEPSPLDNPDPQKAFREFESSIVERFTNFIEIKESRELNE